MPEEHLKLSVEASGAPQAAQQLQGVADAQKKVTEGQTDSAQAAGEAADEQEKLNESDANWLKLLGDLNPALGQKARRIVGLIGELGDLAAQQFKVTDLLSSGAGAAVKNADSLKLIAAGGAVAAGIASIAFTVSQMAQAFREATQAILENSRALDDLQRKQAQAKQTIEDLRAANKGGPFTPEQAQAAGDTFAAVRRRFPFIDEGALQEVLAGSGGASEFAGGGGLSVEEIARAARLRQIDPKTNVGSEASIRRALGRGAGRVEGDFAREAAQRNEDLLRAFQQSSQAGGSTAELQDFIARFAQPGQDPATLARLAQATFGQDLGALQDQLLKATEPGRPDLMFNKWVSAKLTQWGIADYPVAGASAADIATLRAAMTELRDAVRDLAKRPAGVTINQPNGRFIGPDADSQRRRMVNGETSVVSH